MAADSALPLLEKVNPVGKCERVVEVTVRCMYMTNESARSTKKLIRYKPLKIGYKLP